MEESAVSVSEDGGADQRWEKADYSASSVKFFLPSCMGNRVKLVFCPSEQSINVQYLITIGLDCTLTHILS